MQERVERIDTVEYRKESKERIVDTVEEEKSGRQDVRDTNTESQVESNNKSRDRRDK